MTVSLIKLIAIYPSHAVDRSHLLVGDHTSMLNMQFKIDSFKRPIKGTQGNSRELEGTRGKLRELKGTQGNSGEVYITQVA
jgi:hypothetical protein